MAEAQEQVADRRTTEGTDQTAGYPSAWRSDVALKDGQTVHIRPISPADADKLVEFHERQSDESIYFRFFTPRPRLSAKEVRHFTTVDHVNRVAFVAELADQLVGVARYERYGGSDTAEVAFIVDDDHQGRGLGTVLLEYLAAAGRLRGLRRFSASTLPTNRAMLAVFSSAGFDVSTNMSDGVVELSFEIDPTAEFQEVTDRRQRQASAAGVEHFFRPGSVAVLGLGTHASAADAISVAVRERGFAGELVCVGNAAEIPEGTDLAVLSAPSSAIGEAVDAIGARGVGAILILSPGYGEGEGGAPELRSELLRSARRWGVRVMGPNCQALVNTDPSRRLVVLEGSAPTPGPISMLAESGSLARPIVDHSNRTLLGLSTFVATGSRTDVGATDLLSYWCDDPGTRAVLLYLRSSHLSTRFVRVARNTGLNKPVVALGNILVSDTGADPGRDRVEALSRQTGMISVGTMEQLSDIGRLLSSQPIPKGPGVAVVGNSDGTVALAADACRAAGLEMVDLTTTALPLQNPTYLALDASVDQYRSALTAASRSPSVHNIIVVHTPSDPDTTESLARVMAEASAATPEVTFAVTMLGGAGTPRLTASGVGAQVPVFRFPEHAAKAMGRLARWQSWRAGAATQSLDSPAGSDAAAARAVVLAALERSGARSVMLSPREQDELLSSYGITMAQRRIVATIEEAVEAAEEIGWPVALKGTARNRSSRSVASGVSLDIANPAHLRTVWAQMEDTFGDRMHPVTVQEFIDGRMDASVVVRQDARGSGTMELGLGGSAFGADRPAVGLLPLTLGDAQGLVGSSSLARVFTDRLDRVPLVGLLHRISALVVEIDEVEEIRANPIVVTGGMAAIADVDIRVSGSEGELDVRRVD